MWKYCTKEQSLDFLLSLNLIENNYSNQKQIKILYTLSNHQQSHYIKHIIPKKDGTKRILWEPDYLLKTVQKNILKNILNQEKISKYAYAYQKQKSILDNAKQHLNKKTILKLDIKDFFNNITFEMIIKYVFKTIYYPPMVQIVLSNLCCFQNHIPQGAPTSSAISNIILLPFDEYIGSWCAERQITYTRYCDDLTFSGNFDPIPIKNKVESFLNELGFEIKKKKTKIINQSHRQIVTGIIVNKKIQTPREYRTKIRQEVYYCKKYGIENHLLKINSNLTKEKYKQSLLGKINYALYINPEDKKIEQLKKTINNL